MTEDTGFPPDAEAEVQPVPDETADPQEVAEEAAAAEPEPGPADHVPPPWLPAEGVADWLRAAIGELHRRIQNLGG